MLIENILELIHITETYEGVMRAKAASGTMNMVKTYARVPVRASTYGRGILKDSAQSLADTATGGMARVVDAKSLYDSGKEIHGLATANGTSAQKTSLMKTVLSKVPGIGNTLADSAGEKVENHRNFYDVEKGAGALSSFSGKNLKDLHISDIKPGSVTDGLHKTLKSNCQANPQLCRSIPNHLWKT